MWDATTGGNQIQSVTLQQQPGAPAGVPSNRATTITNTGVPSTQAYDGAGNLTGDGVHSYHYDGAGRLASVDSGAATYFYDSSNRRLKKVTGGFTTYYVWEGAQVIAEYSNAPAGAGGNSYYRADRLSNRMVTDSNGTFKGTQDHLPFGEEGGTSGTSEKHRFTTFERDSESGSDYAINRQLEYANSRFMQPDPVGGSAADPQTLNRYSYVANDSINLADPLGLCTINIGIAANSLLTAAQLTAMRDEISRIYGNAGYEISFVSANADYWLNVNARGADYRSFYRNLPGNAVGVTGKSGLRVDNNGRVFVDRLSASAGSTPSYERNSNNLGIGLGRAGAHEIGHYLLQQGYDSASIEGVMHAGFHGEQWYSRNTQRDWTFNASQIARIANKVCITPEKAPLNYAPIGSRIIGGLPGGGLPTGGLGGGNWNIFDLLQLLEGTVTSTYKLEPPKEN